MLRRGRNGRARHLVWSEIWQETDFMAVIQTSDTEECEGQTISQVRHWCLESRKRVMCEQRSVEKYDCETHCAVEPLD